MRKLRVLFISFQMKMYFISGNNVLFIHFYCIILNIHFFEYHNLICLVHLTLVSYCANSISSRIIHIFQMLKFSSVIQKLWIDGMCQGNCLEWKFLLIFIWLHLLTFYEYHSFELQSHSERSDRQLNFIQGLPTILSNLMESNERIIIWLVHVQVKYLSVSIPDISNENKVSFAIYRAIFVFPTLPISNK